MLNNFSLYPVGIRLGKHIFRVRYRAWRRCARNVMRMLFFPLLDRQKLRLLVLLACRLPAFRPVHVCLLESDRVFYSWWVLSSISQLSGIKSLDSSTYGLLITESFFCSMSEASVGSLGW